MNSSLNVVRLCGYASGVICLFKKLPMSHLFQLSTEMDRANSLEMSIECSYLGGYKIH